MIKKTLFLCLVFLLILYKPYYSFLIIPFFYLEYFFFLYFIHIYLYEKKLLRYRSLVCPAYLYYQKDSVTFWIHLNKIKAYKKFYKLVSRDKIRYLDFIKILFIYILQIPVKLIILARDLYFISGNSINAKLSYLYDREHESATGLKIEFYRGKVYLNCYNTRALIKSVFELGLGKKECYSLLRLIKHHTQDFYKFESNEKERVEFSMSKIWLSSVGKVPLTHPACIWRLDMNQYDFSEDAFTLHATSNCKVKLNYNQEVLDPIPELIKPWSTNPGTIMSYRAKCEPVSEFKSVRKVSVEATLNNKKEAIEEKFNIVLNLEYEDYLNEKNKILSDIVYSNVDIKNPHILVKTNRFISDLNSNAWTNALIDVSISEILDLIEKE